LARRFTTGQPEKLSDEHQILEAGPINSDYSEQTLLIKRSRYAEKEITIAKPKTSDTTFLAAAIVSAALKIERGPRPLGTT